MGSCGANRRGFEDQSAIKGNLSQKNAFFVAKQGLIKNKWIRPIDGLSFMHFGEQNVKERKEERKEEKEEKKKKKKKKKRKCMDAMMILYGNCLSMELVWKCVYGY